LGEELARGPDWQLAGASCQMFTLLKRVDKA